MRKMASFSPFIFCFITAIFWLNCLTPGLAACKSALPFKNGERLEFQIKWLFIPAGRAVLQVLSPSRDIPGAAHHFVLTASTYPAIDLIYKFRERVDSYTSALIERTVFYKKRQQGKTERDITIRFNLKRNTAQYTNFKEVLPPVKLPKGTLDPLAALYFIRCQPLIPGQTIERPITDGKKVVIGRLRVIKRESIRLAGHYYKTIKLEPELKEVKGVFEKSKNARMYVWVTADKRKILVRLKSKVIVGSFTATLMNLEILDKKNRRNKNKKAETSTAADDYI
ncbi:DUF3108 domain-containing protein [Desulfobacterota bacterium M19]